MFFAVSVVIISIILWIYVSNVLKPTSKYGSDVNSFDRYIDESSPSKYILCISVKLMVYYVELFWQLGFLGGAGHIFLAFAP